MQRLGKYEWGPQDFLGEGSFGKVYKGKNAETGQVVAVKCMDMKNFKDPYMLESLKNEVSVMKQLSSPHVVRMLDFQQDPHTTYIILEFCKDGDLDHYIRRKGGMLTEKDALDVLSQLLDGFKNLVQLGYIHRDIKPANSLVEGGVHKVADFGFAKKVDTTGRQLITDNVGTPLYMAPQLLLNQPYTAKSDIWSIGFMFYEMLFGKTPWPCRDLNSFTRNLQTQPLRFPYEKSIGSQTKNFIEGCLKVNEAQRFGWDQVFSHPLAQLQTGQVEQPTVSLDNQAQQILRNMQKAVQAKGWDIQQIFIQFDSDKCGALDGKEFYRLMNAIDPRITSQESNHVFRFLDAQNKGNITLKQFKEIFVSYDFADLQDKGEQIIADLREVIKANKISVKQLFEHHDKDKGGSLDRNELAYLLRKIAPKLRDFEVDDCLRKFDKNGDGKISLREFEEQLAFGLSDYPNNKFDPQEEKAQKLVSQLKTIIQKHGLDLKQIFSNFDKSKDGKLDKNEFTQICLIVDKTLYTQDIECIYKKFDKNGDGINFSEFYKVLN